MDQSYWRNSLRQLCERNCHDGSFKLKIIKEPASESKTTAKVKRRVELTYTFEDVSNGWNWQYFGLY